MAHRQNICNFTFCYSCLIHHKVWVRLDKNYWSSILKFPAPYGPVLTKSLKCHINFSFWQITKTFVTFYPPMTSLFIIKFGANPMKIVGVAFWNFCMLTKRKKKCKNLKIETFEKKKMLWRYGGWVAAKKIWSGSTEQFPRNLSLRTDDGRLRHKSSSADKFRQS